MIFVTFLLQKLVQERHAQLETGPHPLAVLIDAENQNPARHPRLAKFPAPDFAENEEAGKSATDLRPQVHKRIGAQEVECRRFLQ